MSFEVDGSICPLEALSWGVLSRSSSGAVSVRLKTRG